MKRAVKHLDTIYDFLAKKNEQAAIKVYNEFLRLAAMEKGIPVHPRFFFI